jgi:hypothetical protein
MNTIYFDNINDKLKKLPDNLLAEVEKYIDFLTYKHNDTDWANTLSEEQAHYIKKGIDDIANQRILTHEDAVTKINKHIKKISK